jgi:FK506-binding nuclear protein
MRYIGKLENGKVFDSNTKGAPLTFTLGRGQVISGWDKGIVGMQVGGERKLRIRESHLLNFRFSCDPSADTCIG